LARGEDEIARAQSPALLVREPAAGCRPPRCAAAGPRRDGHEVDLDQRAEMSRPVVPTVVRGGGVGKNSRHTSSKALNVHQVGVEHCALTTCSSDVPAPRTYASGSPARTALLLDGRAVVRKRGIHARLGGHAGLEVARELAGGEDEVATRAAGV
jgi:hypothetical protein